MDTKQWYQSKGIWGTLIAGLSLLLQLTGVADVSPEEQGALSDNIVGLTLAGGEIFGIILAFIGRLKAKQTIGAA